MTEAMLITGTTSGIGYGLLKYYSVKGWRVIGVNQNSQPDAVEFPNSEFPVLDITSRQQVEGLIAELDRRGIRPKVMILNAGINKPDNLVSKFDFDVFSEVIDTNLAGVLTFIAAAQKAGWRGVQFVGISSSSNIVPNPGHFAYYLSKWGIYKGFQFLQKSDSENVYKSVVLGPVRTQIMRYYEGPQGYQRKLLNFLMAEVDDFVPRFDKFLNQSRGTLYFPFRVCAFYWFMRIALACLPGLYGGTRTKVDLKQV